MLPSISTITALALAVLFSGQIQAKEEDQLLPTAAVAKMDVRYTADGRALHVTIKNDSALALTAGKVVCDKYDSKLPKPRVASTGFPWCSGEEAGVFISGAYKRCEYNSPYLAWFDETIKPGKSKELYFELKDYQVPVLRCEIKDLRGRAAKFWE